MRNRQQLNQEIEKQEALIKKHEDNIRTIKDKIKTLRNTISKVQYKEDLKNGVNVYIISFEKQEGIKGLYGVIPQYLVKKKKDILI